MVFFETKNSLPQIINDVTQVISQNRTKSIVWFGYVYLVDVIQTFLIQKGYKIDYVVDNDSRKWGRATCAGLAISSPEKALQDKDTKDTLVLLFSNYADEIEKQLLSYGYNREDIYRFEKPDYYSSQYKAAFLDSVGSLKKMGLREIQLTQLDILKALRTYCDTHKLRYYLAGGTCFGAVNYKGFVPWDDDIDVYMPVDDYTKLVNGFSHDRYHVLDWRVCDDFYWPYAQMVDTKTVMFYDSSPLCARQGLFIDIIPLTGYPDGGQEIERFITENALIESKWRYFYNSRGIVETADERKPLWEARYRYPFDTSANIATAVELWGGEEQWILPRAAFEYGNTLEFEGEMFSVMMDYKAYLKLRARKYEGKPKASVQVSHPIYAYWKG